MGLSPWVVHNIRFDESLGRLHGYDLDFCLQVRSAGRKVVTADFKAIHNHSLDLVSNPDSWMEAHMRVAEKWDGKMPRVGEAGGDWKYRARRAEAEAAVNMALAVTNQLKGDARALQLKRELDEMKTSIGWRITEPLRRINYWRRNLFRSRRTAETGAATSRGITPAPEDRDPAVGATPPARGVSPRG
jgi:GT2 family glycosyltransferase